MSATSSSQSELGSPHDGTLDATTGMDPIQAEILLLSRSVQDIRPQEARCDDTRPIRERLPLTLSSWRLPPAEYGGFETAGEAIWELLRPFFNERGYTLWRREFACIFGPEGDGDSEDTGEYSSGFGYATSHRGLGPGVGSVNDLFAFEQLNPLCMPAHKADGRDVVIRVLAIGSHGREHIDILKVISKGPYAFLNDNHAIPILDLPCFDNIVFGVFPKIGYRMQDAYRYWTHNSVGDVLDMILQCLEGLAFIHGMKIAHRDAFKDNFLVQWHPESLSAGHIPRSRPRVFLTDFEVAVMFPNETALKDCLVNGFPIGGSYADDVKSYTRPVPPEVHSGNPYDPFKLDVWQFGTSLDDFKSTIPAVDRILEDLRLPDAAARLSSFHALEYLSEAIAELTPKTLMLPPVTPPRPS
ncbi:hypothetical protein C8Q78DRAFT_672709 [Trametes maxima]|nr:hypothetical protein C8Q78DRAFT_672709 [Trametes maxima]